MNNRTIARVGATAAVAAILVVGMPLAASAHVAVTPNQAKAGDDVSLTFRVPNESATAGTVKVEIDLPTATPFAGAEYDPVPGWTAQIDTEKLSKPIKNDGVDITEAPVKVTFTADKGVQIKEGQFQEFALALDVAPDAEKVEFHVIQTYSDGKVVNWDESTPASGEEPENPAPTLYLNAEPPAEGHDAGHDEKVGVQTDGGAAAASTATSALILGSAGLGLGVIALVFAIFAFVRSRPKV